MKVVEGFKSCTRIRPMLDSYLSNELLVETNHDILNHLGECPECHQVLQSRGQMRDLLRRAITTVETPADLQENLAKRLRGVEPLPTARRRRSQWTWVIAAALAIFAVGGLSIQTVAVAARQDSLLRVGWTNHVSCTLGGGILGRTTDDPGDDLEPQYRQVLSAIREQMGGYRILRAHHCPVNGRRLAHLVLKKEHSLMSVSIMTKEKGERIPPRGWFGMSSPLPAIVASGVEVAGFETSNHLVFVTSNQSRAENMRIATSLAPRLRETLNLRSSAVPGPVYALGPVGTNRPAAR